VNKVASRGLRVARLIITLLGLAGGFALAFYGLPVIEGLMDVSLSATDRTSIVTLVAALCGLLAYAGSVSLLNTVWRSASWAVDGLQRMPMQDILSGAAGLIVGLIIANQFAGVLGRIPWAGGFLPSIAGLVLGYVGMAVGIRKREEIGAMIWLLIPRLRSERQSKEAAPERLLKVLDTSVIIDGRIADVAKAGFLEGPLMVPAFVLEELRRIADSSDSLRRNRGRRGLDVLDSIQQLSPSMVQIVDRDPGGEGDVDAKLVKLAKTMKAKIVTNDYNLNRVAQLQGVDVLNVNELANALKPIVLPGEDMVVQVIRDGKEQGQGVGYLDDGTMIVVEGGRRHIGEQVAVQVTSVYQTGAGRMIFARPRTQNQRNEKAAE
jgi:uncharacterized protein YacL